VEKSSVLLHLISWDLEAENIGASFVETVEDNSTLCIAGGRYACATIVVAAGSVHGRCLIVKGLERAGGRNLCSSQVPIAEAARFLAVTNHGRVLTPHAGGLQTGAVVASITTRP
jgi:hypothetical protein